MFLEMEKGMCGESKEEGKRHQIWLADAEYMYQFPQINVSMMNYKYIPIFKMKIKNVGK